MGSGVGRFAACATDRSNQETKTSVDVAKGDKNMNHVALLVRLESKPGKEADVEAFLKGGLPIVEGEPETTSWFAIRLGPTTFGIFDTFPGEAGRKAHLAGKVAAALMANAPTLLAVPPVIENVDVLATKLLPNAVHVGLVVRLEVKPGKESDVADFLKGGLQVVQEEPETTSWFALRLGPTTFGIFDAFPGESGRAAHLSGRVAVALMAGAPELLSQAPDIQKVDVLASKLPK